VNRHRRHKIDQGFSVMRPDRPGIGVMMVLEPKLIGRQRIQIGLRPCRRQARARSQSKYRKQPHAK
jgi:hypothetical protein